MALNLLMAYWRCFIFLLQEQPNHDIVRESTNTSGFQNHVLYDYYLALLIKYKKHDQFQEEMDRLSLDFKLHTVQRMPKTLSSAKELEKPFKKARTMVANALVRSILTDPDPTNLNLTKSQFILENVTTHDDQQQQPSPPLPSDAFFVTALSEWMALTLEENENKFERLLHKLMNDTKFSKHMYLCSKTLKEMVSS